MRPVSEKEAGSAAVGQCTRIELEALPSACLEFERVESSKVVAFSDDANWLEYSARTSRSIRLGASEVVFTKGQIKNPTQVVLNRRWSRTIARAMLAGNLSSE